MAARCPHPECGGAVSATQWPGFCDACHLPVSFCPDQHCRQPNRTLARFCRTCGKKLTPPQPRERLATLPQPNAELHHLKFDEPVRTTPKSYAGFVWFISEGGVLHRLSPRSDRPAAVAVLGGEFGHSQWMIATDRATGHDADAVVIPGPRTLLMVNMATSTRRILYQCRDGEELTVDTAERHTGLAELGESFYLLGRRDGRSALLQVGRDGNSNWYELKDGEGAAGPVVLEQYVLAFSEKWLYWLHKGTVRRAQWYGEFVPDCAPAVTAGRGFAPAFGQLPFGRTRHGALVEGSRSGRASLALISDISNNEPSAAVWPVDQEEGLYALSGDDNLLAATSAGVKALEAGQLRLVRQDALGMGLSAPYHDGTVTAYAATDGVGGRFLRLLGAREPMDWPLAYYPEYAQGMAFLPCAGDLVHVYCTDDMKVRFLVWRT